MNLPLHGEVLQFSCQWQCKANSKAVCWHSWFPSNLAALQSLENLFSSSKTYKLKKPKPWQPAHLGLWLSPHECQTIFISPEDGRRHRHSALILRPQLLGFRLQRTNKTPLWKQHPGKTSHRFSQVIWKIAMFQICPLNLTENHNSAIQEGFNHST